VKRTADYRYELNEAKSELARHHRDFIVISRLCEVGLDPDEELAPETALRLIRNVVG
jgi:hypothetical protein